MDSMEQDKTFLGTEPIGKLLLKLAVPTVIAQLVNMLYNMDDMSSIGPNMAVALLTTLYGSLLSNWICIPVSFKLTMKNEDEITMKPIMVEGLLSIQAGENPRVIEEKLKSFLSPSERENAGEDGQAGEAAAEGGEA